MRNDQTTGSPRSMRLNAEGDQEIQALAILLAVGLCRAIAAGSIPAAFACRRFLKPALLKQLKDAGAPSKLVEVLELGSELEFVERLVPEKLQNAAQEVEAHLLEILKGCASDKNQEWLLATLDEQQAQEEDERGR